MNTAQPNAADGLPPLRDVIRRHDLSARKSLGQNFLLDLNLTGRIA
ncbi:MAG: rRNA (adenine1518-N6/adenine1519-N6)-dimethyltransferase, partial [Hyphomicrobiales bacterium]